MTAEEYYRLLPDGVAPRLVRMAQDFAALADADPDAAGRKLDVADVIFAVWQAENGAFGFIPVFGGDRLANRGRILGWRPSLRRARSTRVCSPIPRSWRPSRAP